VTRASERWVLVLALAACGGAQKRGGVSPNDAIIYVTSNVGDAAVYVDGRFIGPITMVKRGIAMDPGRHRLELRHDDYFSRYAELDLHRAEKKKLDLDMAPVLP
jgi:PEGA domain-containing protein